MVVTLQRQVCIRVFMTSLLTSVEKIGNDDKKRG